jgi:uracil-DNA glycosylase
MKHGFFPGGNGLYEGDKASQFPIRGTLILGSNFGSVEDFVYPEGKLKREDERGNPTWRSLLKSLNGAKIEKNECFFTNAWPFLHAGARNTETKVEAWLRNADLMAACTEFFRYTCATMQPKLIVTLGKGPAAFLSYMWPEELAPWRKCKLKSLDDLPKARVAFQEQSIICVGITHPSIPNARQRKAPYQYSSGETQLLMEAREESEQFRALLSHTSC